MSGSTRSACVAFEDNVMIVYVLMTLIAVNQKHPPELSSGLFVPIEFLSCHWPYQHWSGFPKL
jgi:hypothetical protein